MDDEIKQEYDEALLNLEKLFQSMGINESQQEQLTKCLAAFGEAFDDIISWCRILDKYASRLDSLGETTAHTGPKTLENRLDIIEGMQDIFCSAHKGHTNYSETEFIGMHGDSYKRLEGIQIKLDRITKILDNPDFKITMSIKDALKL